TITLEEEIDIARGDVLAHATARPEVVDQFAAQILWMSEEAMLPGRSYLMRIGTKYVPARVTRLKHRVDVNSLEHIAARTRELHARGAHTYLLDGDNVRHGLNRDLGFTDADRVENIRRVGEVAKLFVDVGAIVLCSFISPFRAERRMVREQVEAGDFIEVFIDTPLAECMRRDPKGLYARAQAGQIKNFTGIDSPYEPPEHAEIVIDTPDTGAEDSARGILKELRRRHIVA